MQALGLVRISKKQNFVEISFKKNSECKKWNWAHASFRVGIVSGFTCQLCFTCQSPRLHEDQECSNAAKSTKCIWMQQ